MASVENNYSAECDFGKEKNLVLTKEPTEAVQLLKSNADKFDEEKKQEAKVEKWGMLTPRPVGLVNLADNCYMNSVLQTLAYSSPVFKVITTMKHSPPGTTPEKISMSSELHQMLTVFAQDRTSSSDNKPFSSTTLVFNQKQISPYFEYKEQQDAMECWTGIVDKLCHETSILCTALSGNIRIKIICTMCGKGETHRERFTDIGLDLSADGPTTVDSSLNKYFSPEIIEHCTCNSCNNSGTKIKGVWIEDLPDVLVFQIKRFNFTEKNCSYVDFPQELAMEKFLVPDYDLLLEDTVYRLYSVVAHYGDSAKSGHYTAYIKAPDGEWYHCDDETVTVTTSEACHNAEDPYILFYERRSIRPKCRSLLGRSLLRSRVLLKNWNGRFQEWLPLVRRLASLIWCDVIPVCCDWFIEVNFDVKFLHKVYLLYRDIRHKLEGKSTKVDIQAMMAHAQRVLYTRQTPTIPDIILDDTNEEYSDIDEEIEEETSSDSTAPTIPDLIWDDTNEECSDIDEEIEEETSSDSTAPTIPDLILDDTNEEYRDIDEEIEEKTSSDLTASTILPTVDVLITTAEEVARRMWLETSESSSGSDKGLRKPKKKVTFADDCYSSSSSSESDSDTSFSSGNPSSSSNLTASTILPTVDVVITTVAEMAQRRRLEALKSSSASDKGLRKHKANVTKRKQLASRKVTFADDYHSSSSSSEFDSDTSFSSGISSSSGSDDNVVKQRSHPKSLHTEPRNENNSNNSSKWSLKQGLCSTISSLVNTGISIYNRYNSMVL